MTQTPHQAQAAPSQGSKFWDDILSLGVRRDRSRQWFGGVCAGIARRFDIDPVLVRAAVIALTLFGGFGIVAYVVAWLLMPDENGRIMARDALDGDASTASGGAIALTVFGILVVAAIVFGDNGFLIGWGIVPLAIVGWFLWRHQQGKNGAGPSPWTSASQDGPAGPDVYAASSAPASHAPSAPVTSTASTAPTAPFSSTAPTAPVSPAGGWQPPPAPPVPPQARLPLAPPPPPRPRRRGAGFAGFALALGAGIVGYGAGLMLDGPLGFGGSRELLGGVLALGAASLATLVIGLMGRRSILSAILVLILGLGTVGAAVGEDAWGNGQGTRTWTPVPSSTVARYELGAGQSTLDLRTLVAQLAVATPSVAPSASATPSPSPSAAAPSAPSAPAALPAPTVPQQVEVTQGAGEMRIIVPRGASARITATSTFGEVTLDGDLPGVLSDRDRGDTDGPSETMVVNLGTGTPTVIVDATIRFGQITIQEG
jgi:phage shock protein PspC (stress-responsive transcriptional regulator)